MDQQFVSPSPFIQIDSSAAPIESSVFHKETDYTTQSFILSSSPESSKRVEKPEAKDILLSSQAIYDLSRVFQKEEKQNVEEDVEKEEEQNKTPIQKKLSSYLEAFTFDDDNDDDDKNENENENENEKLEKQESVQQNEHQNKQQNEHQDMRLHLQNWFVDSQHPDQDDEMPELVDDEEEEEEDQEKDQDHSTPCEIEDKLNIVDSVLDTENDDQVEKEQNKNQDQDQDKLNIAAAAADSVLDTENDDQAEKEQNKNQDQDQDQDQDKLNIADSVLDSENDDQDEKEQEKELKTILSTKLSTKDNDENQVDELLHQFEKKVLEEPLHQNQKHAIAYLLPGETKLKTLCLIGGWVLFLTLFFDLLGLNRHPLFNPGMVVPT